MEKKPVFKLSFKPTKLFYINFAIVFLFVILCECGMLPFSEKGYSVVALFFIFFSLVRFEFREIPLWDILIPIANSILATFLFQLTLVRGIELNTITLIGNIALNAGITYIFLVITNRVRLAITLSNILLYGFAFIDYLVISFRGSEIKFSDIYSLDTAASVAGQYKIDFTTRINYLIIIFIAVTFVLWITKITHKSKKNQLPRITGVLLCGVSLFVVSWCMNHSENYMQLWATDGIRYNGLTYNFFIEARDSRVTVPDGYSEESAEEILSSYTSTESDKDTPHIIVIMSEAFADLSILGDFDTNEDPMAFYNSLTENATKGYAVTSVYGGGTATSEWEFLTGNTQAFLPYGSIAYQQYIKKKATSIIDIMNDNGYTTVAMHPYRAAGWRRNVVYDIFDFDEIYFEEELSSDGKLRGLVSDETFFGDIINRFENKKEGEKLFTFAITMQNHGGYEYGGFPSEVTVEGMDILSVNQYLTLLKKSDDALRDLISYFENTDEKTMIVLFGDHLPAIGSQFYTEVMGDEANTYQGKMKKYTVPFTIWTNYDSEEETVEVTSLNYLSTIMMKKAGIGLTPYFSYLDFLYEAIPSISYFGYYSEESGGLKSLVEASGDELDLINQYKIVQYNNIFNP